MEDLRVQTLGVLASLTEEQIRLVLEYAERVKDGQALAPVHGLEELLEEPA